MAAFMNGYRTMNRIFPFLLAALLIVVAPVYAADNERTVKSVHFAKGSSDTVIKDSIHGYHFVDYQLRAGAGQTLKVSLQTSNGANYFNVLPPGSADVAMYNASTAGNRFEGLLPDDGVYSIRVYLMRAAARRNERADFSLSIGVTGKPLRPVSAKVDALIPGTPFHAKTIAPCVPAYSQVRECEALVIRRGFDGTATVVVRWDKTATRRILFVKGQPVVSDAMQPMSHTRDEKGWIVRFYKDESFVVPEPLVFGG